MGAKGRVGKSSRRKAKIAAPKHGGREAVHDGLRLDVKVSEHFVRSPTSDHAQAVAVNARAEQRHGAARTGGADRDVAQRIRRVGMEMEDGDEQTKVSTSMTSSCNGLLVPRRG